VLQGNYGAEDLRTRDCSVPLNRSKNDAINITIQRLYHAISDLLQILYEMVRTIFSHSLRISHVIVDSVFCNGVVGGAFVDICYNKRRSISRVVRRVRCRILASALATQQTSATSNMNALISLACRATRTNLPEKHTNPPKNKHALYTCSAHDGHNWHARAR